MWCPLPIPNSYDEPHSGYSDICLHCCSAGHQGTNYRDLLRHNACVYGKESVSQESEE